MMNQIQNTTPPVAKPNTCSPAILSVEGNKGEYMVCWCYTAADIETCVAGEQGGTTLQDRTFMTA